MSDYLKGWGWYVGDMNHVDEKARPTGLVTAVIFEKSGGPKRYSAHAMHAADAMYEAAKLYCLGEGHDTLRADHIVYTTVPAPEE